MRQVALALLLCLSACDDAPAHVGGTSGADGSSSSSSGELDETGGEESTGGESGSTGGNLWDGATITVRTIDAEPDRSCENSCGASVCLAADNGFQSFDCDNSPGAGVTCTCSDDAEKAGTAPTHAVSECFRGTDVSGPSGFDMEAIEQWDGRSCDDFCAAADLGACAWTQWVRGDSGCYEVDAVAQSTGLVLQYGEEMTIRTPFEDGEGGRLRFVCEL